MRHPATDLAGHLMWTRHGTVWATWRICALAYNGTIEDKRAVAAAHRLLARALGGESLYLSYVVPEDPVTVVDRMVAGIDLSATPMWIQECEATMDRLEDLPIGERFFWLSVPLANHGRRRYAEPFRSAWRNLKDLIDLPVDRPADPELTARATQAGQIEQLIPAPFRPQRATVAEQVWLAAHAKRRGQLDLPVPDRGSLTAELLTGSAAAITAPLLDEGARADDDAPSRVNVMRQRVLKVTDPAGSDIHGLQPSYQALLALADTPAGGMIFPGSEWLFALDRTGIDVDWAIRVRTNARDSVLARNRKAVRQLNEQYDQREAEQTTGQHDLDLAAGLLAEYSAIFANDKQEVEIEHTVLLAVSAARTDPTQSDAEVNALAQDQAAVLAKAMHDSAGIKLERPPGHQGELWWAMQPGVPRSRLVQAYAQYTSSAHFARLVPFITIALGGRTGPLLAVSTLTSRPRPVHLDLGGYAELDISGDILAVAEKGAGKSVAQKTLCSHLVALGGQFWAIDKSEDGEWAKFVTSFDSHLVVDALQPRWSMDPMRILTGEGGLQVMRSFLVQLLNIDTQDLLGVLLSQLLEPGYATEHHLDCAEDLIGHVEALAGNRPATPTTPAAGPRKVAGSRRTGRVALVDTQGAPELARRLRAWSRMPLTAAVFDPDLPPADLTVPATAWRTHGMEQPNADELTQAHLFRQLPPEKIYGRAYYRLLTGLARRLCFADRSRVASWVLDEFYDIAQNPENVQEVMHFLRRGRRGKASIIAGTHDVGDLHDDVLAGLIPTRILMRHRDETLARRGLRWLGIHDDDPELGDYLKTVTTDLSPVLGDQGVPPERRGECYIRDAFGNFAPAKILPPADPSRRAAVLTTPPKSRVRT